MKIIGWTCFDDPNREELYPISQPVSWEDLYEVEDMIAEEIRSKGYKFSGYYYQGGQYGCPVFDNGKWYGVSFRRWGEIMAKAYDDHGDEPDTWNYTKWAWIAPEEETYPNPDDYDGKEPAFIPVTKDLLNEIFEFSTWPWHQKIAYYALSFFGKLKVSWYTYVMMPIWEHTRKREEE